MASRQTRIVAVIVVAATALAGCAPGASSESEWERFKRECTSRHGFVAQTGDGNFWGVTRYDCIVGNQVIYLPGFAP